MANPTDRSFQYNTTQHNGNEVKKASDI